MWTLTSENGGNIQLTFVSFELELEECNSEYYYIDEDTYGYKDECTCYDYVEVSYGTYSEKFCGDIVPETITSCGGRSIVMQFHSGSDITGTGFRAEWVELTTSTPCPTNRDFPNSSIHDNLDQVEATLIQTMYLCVPYY